MESPSRSVICEEVFDDTSHPSADEIRDYAAKIGIDPHTEPQFLKLAAEGLMKPLPPGWQPLFHERKQAYYYYNSISGKTQWEHPLDDLYRGIVVRARRDSQSLSVGDVGEDATYTRDDLPSLEEAPFFPAPAQPRKLPPMNVRPKTAQAQEQPLDDLDLGIKNRAATAFRRSSLHHPLFSSDDKKSPSKQTTNEPSVLSGGGSMFLKSNTQKLKGSRESLFADDGRENQPLRSILRECTKTESMDKSDEEDKKSVRFNNDTNPDVTFFFSEESDTDDGRKTDAAVDVGKVQPTMRSSRFTVSPAFLPETHNLKLVKPSPGDFLKLDKASDSEEESGVRKSERKEAIVESDSDSFITKREVVESRGFVGDLGKHDDDDEELTAYKKTWFDRQKVEMEKTLVTEKHEQESRIKTELEKLRVEMDNRLKGTLTEEKVRLQRQLADNKAQLVKSYEEEENNYKLSVASKFEAKKRDLEQVHKEKLLLMEKEMGEKLEKAKDELIVSHNAILDQMRHNHARILEQLQKDHKTEEELMRKEHQKLILELKNKVTREVDERSRSMGNDEEQLYEKVRCEKRLLEDKYRCLKDKYLKLKTEVKLSIEKRNRKKEQSLTTTTNTTGSETEKSPTIKKSDRATHHSPSTHRKHSPKHARAAKVEVRARHMHIHDLDTSASDRSYQHDDKYGGCNDSQREYDSSDVDGGGVARGRRKLFSRLKCSSTATRSNSGARGSKECAPRSYSPVENLRKQLQKLEDLEDQFPQQSQVDTYHLRYPFTDAHKFEGSSELEFFRHRIHLERDSIRMAKESLKNQRSHFKQRQSELKLKHGHYARHTLEQLCQEEKELTDMEVSLHRTRSLLGEKVIRLRHLEQSLQRATASNEQQKHDEATLSDLSSHSASSGISSTDYADSPGTKQTQFKESSEIIQSLENLNSEIREIWEVLHKQQQNSNISAVLPPLPLIYPELSWPILGGVAPVPPSIPTLADRLQNYRQHMALANAQRTIVTHDNSTQAATTTLVEKTRNLRQWLRQTTVDTPTAEGATSQTTL